jgi:hypothetical protein
MPNTHQRDPVSGEDWFFVDDLILGDGRKDAQTYYELALRYCLTFREIHAMAFAVLGELIDLERVRELDTLRAQAKQFTRALSSTVVKPPIKEVLMIWMRSREALLRGAELFPERREMFEAAVAEQEDMLLAIIERYGQKARAN